MHTVLQTQYSLGMSLTSQERSGHVLGRMNAFQPVGDILAALVFVFLVFQFDLFSFKPTFVIIGVVSAIGALVIIRFPHLHEGEERKVAPERERIVWNVTIVTSICSTCWTVCGSRYSSLSDYGSGPSLRGSPWPKFRSY